MAGFALVAHPPLVHIFFSMASTAFFRSIRVNLGLVTSCAGCSSVLADKWKGRCIVIDLHRFPVFRGMASLAAFAELTLVRVFVSVTGNTAHVELVFVKIAFMTTDA